MKNRKPRFELTIIFANGEEKTYAYKYVSNALSICRNIERIWRIKDFYVIDNTTGVVVIFKEVV